MLSAERTVYYVWLARQCDDQRGGILRRTAVALSGLLVLGCCLLTVGCGSGEGATSTLKGGANTLTDPATTPSGGITSTTVAPGAALLGKWRSSSSGETMDFRTDGTITGTYADRVGKPLTYLVSGHQLTIKSADWVMATFTYSVSGVMLTLTDNESRAQNTLMRVQ